MHPLSVGYKVMTEGLRPIIPSECPSNYRTLMETCWHPDPNHRPSFQALLDILENFRHDPLSKFVNTMKDFTRLQSNQVEGFDVDPSIELDEISAETSPPTGEVTMVMVDIAKWETLWADTTIPMSKVVNLYNMILRREMRRMGGYEVSIEGRLCRVTFQDPLKAIEWCIKIQLSLLEAPWPDELLNNRYSSVLKDNNGNFIRRGLLVAMGVNTGVPTIILNPISNRPEYNGTPVIKTAAICKISQYGQILIGDQTRKQIENQLPKFGELKSELKNLGEQSLSGFPDLELIYQIIPERLKARVFASQSTQSKPHLVRGISDFQRTSFSDSTTLDYNNDNTSASFFKMAVSKKEKNEIPADLLDETSDAALQTIDAFRIHQKKRSQSYDASGSNWQKRKAKSEPYLEVPGNSGSSLATIPQAGDSSTYEKKKSKQRRKSKVEVEEEPEENGENGDKGEKEREKEKGEKTEKPEKGIEKSEKGEKGEKKKKRRSEALDNLVPNSNGNNEHELNDDI